jgi:hypothetical protein
MTRISETVERVIGACPVSHQVSPTLTQLQASSQLEKALFHNVVVTNAMNLDHCADDNNNKIKMLMKDVEKITILNLMPMAWDSDLIVTLRMGIKLRPTWKEMRMNLTMMIPQVYFPCLTLQVHSVFYW